MNEQPTTDTATAALALDDTALDAASGGIIAILIGLAFEPKVPGDGSVKPKLMPVAAPTPR